MATTNVTMRIDEELKKQCTCEIHKQTGYGSLT